MLVLLPLFMSKYVCVSKLDADQIAIMVIYINNSLLVVVWYEEIFLS